MNILSNLFTHPLPRTPYLWVSHPNIYKAAVRVRGASACVILAAAFNYLKLLYDSCHFSSVRLEAHIYIGFWFHKLITFFCNTFLFKIEISLTWLTRLDIIKESADILTKNALTQADAGGCFD